MHKVYSAVWCLTFASLSIITHALYQDVAAKSTNALEKQAVVLCPNAASNNTSGKTRKTVHLPLFYYVFVAKPVVEFILFLHLWAVGFSDDLFCW